ncbi:glycosyltransferase family 2 protein [Hutsoniella sourekii]|uniref:glycosyltransferase family 2 protein n=1 Tax=Hutsoniella sourekii TaxID=87650 RepID=UPI000482DD35|nr:glycosyltransferase family 2 protein [Hutsoniella sourekii]
MVKEVFLSIIIPMYNSESFIQSLLKSIIYQNVDFQVEVIVVDDGSTDNSVKIVKSYRRYDDRIILLQQENSGAPKARNYGLRNSRGKYVYFVDADDNLAKDSLKHIGNKLKDQSPDLLIGSVKVVDQDFNIKTSMIYDNETYTNSYHSISDLIMMKPLPGNKIILKEILIDNDIYFSDLKIGQDLNFYLKYLPFCKKIITMEEFVYKYYLRENSISHSYSSKIADIVNSIENAEDFLKDNGIEEVMNWETLKLQHYYLQYSKVPLIEDDQERKLTGDILYTSMKKVDLSKVVNLQHILTKTKLKLFLHPIYMSNSISKIIRKLHFA